MTNKESLIQCQTKIEMLSDFIEKIESNKSMLRLLTNYRSRLTREKKREAKLSECIRKSCPPEKK